MEVVTVPNATLVDVQTSGVSWASIAAGAVAAAALTLMLVAFGTALGLSAISPWADSGVSATTFKVGSGIYLCVVAVMASSVGGYLAARLRTKWTGLHTNEVFFRDTAHGFIAWAFATVLSASVLGAAATHIVNGVAQGVGAAAPQMAQNTSPAEIYVDRLFRVDPATQPAAGTAPVTATQPASGNADAVRSEILRLWTSSFRDRRDLAADDRTYVARLVAARTGLSQAEAEKRVNDVVTEAKAAADRARREAAQLAFWLTASLLLGAFAASLAAVEGGQLRDGNWSGRVLTPRQI
ncbi:MAG: hypothetical protein QOI12_3760 [Alphaproteobacteria bacterium]|jgi:hypothetical protein|nr:hypothetical protein [Alphaproteobacteria bacterium]